MKSLANRLGWALIGALSEVKERLPVWARAHRGEIAARDAAILALQKQVNECHAYASDTHVYLVTVFQSEKVAFLLAFGDARRASAYYRLCRDVYGSLQTQQFNVELNHVPGQVHEFERLYALMESTK